jgi:long-chain acyl-CoA synthetase
MRRDTLLDFFEDVSAAPGIFLVYDDGLRLWRYTYAEVAAAARRFAARLDAAGIGAGDAVIIWGENRPEWIAALWGCLLRGIVAVPIDYRASADFLLRVRAISGARIALVGDEVPPRDAAAWPADLEAWPLAPLLADRTPPRELAPAAVTADTVAEIIFTSGATAEPKGVVITHRNILANLVPIEREVRRYRAWGRPFFPIRFLDLLPLSHMFGQAMAAFIPPMLPGTVVFMRGYNPHDIVRTVRERRVSVIVCVPKMLDVLREHILRQAPSAAAAAAGAAAAPDEAAGRWWQRWWRHRDVHRLFGWKFWCFVVGAAPLDPALEAFWSRLGFLVVQGYGLTETAPIVTLNHPFSARRGSVGKPIAGVEVRIAPDGEILVRGDNVTRGYYRAEADTAEAFEDGWLHTGDIGSLDEEGRLVIRGRKKEMIVTPEGLNVFPEDVEGVLLAQPGVRDAAVVGRTWQGEERVHAVLVVDPGADVEAIVAGANAALADYQRIRGVSIWPAAALPRTEGTGKLRRREVKAWVEAGEGPPPARAGAEAPVAAIVARFAHGRTDLGLDTAIDALGLTSLERVELLMALEERFHVTLDEAALAAARTVGDIEALVARSGQAPAGTARPVQAGSAGATAAPETGGRGAAPGAAVAAEPMVFPTWNRGWLARAIRRLSLPTWILPLTRAFVWLRVEGREHLEGLTGPVILAANHQSHLDSPAILAALPPRVRYRVAIAMAKEFFRAHFHPEEAGWRSWLTNSLNYYLAALFFNAFPLPQREAGTREALRYIGELASDGWSVLIFPEGKRTDRGEINPFRPGVGMIGARLGLPVVPVRLEGLERILHHSWRMARPGRARVRFGPPLRLEGDDYAALARRVEEAVRAL